MAKIYDFKAQTSKGKELDFAQFEGKVLLIVSTSFSSNHLLRSIPIARA